VAAAAAAAAGKKDRGKGRTLEEREKNAGERKRAARYARAPLPGLYGNVGQIYHSGLTVQFSYLPRAACRSTPNHPRALQGRTEVVGGERGSCLVNGGRRTADRGLKRPDRGSANTSSCHPLPPARSLAAAPRNLHFPSNLPPTPQRRPPCSSSSFSFLDLRQRSDRSSVSAESSEMTDCTPGREERGTRATRKIRRLKRRLGPAAVYQSRVCVLLDEAFRRSLVRLVVHPCRCWGNNFVPML